MEAARRAISSPLLEGASVNGARGVIINVTGGPDLSLAEVCEASSIIQEAADEDANIIFGAVVDPNLTGRVKITVIATGFGPQTSAKPALPAAQTPVDMSIYAEHGRARAESGGSAFAAPVAAPRMSLARRPPLELPHALPHAVAGGTSTPAVLSATSITSTTSAPSPQQSAPSASSQGAPLAAVQATTDAVDPDVMRLTADPDFDLSSTFDVPAFLRRQEG